jgi:hypothetical protein
MSDATSRVVNGTTWHELCDALKSAGDLVLSPDQPNDPLTRAEGQRFLSRLLRAALGTFVEHNDPKVPVLARNVDEITKMGADNPDIVYFNATISGAYRYRIRCRRGTVHFLSFATQWGDYGRSMGMPPTGQIDSSALSVRDDGTFDVLLACERPATLGRGETWLPMTPETGTLIVRQFRHRPDEVLAELRIERTGGDSEKPAPLSAEAFDRGMQSAGMFVKGASMLFASWARMFQEHTNRLPQMDPALSNRFGGLSDITYYHSYWRLAADEALVIDAMPPRCDHWNFQLNNHWMESLDYRYFRIHTNSSIAERRTDGSIRIVVAQLDPGVPNWLETAGHDFGTMCFRWVRPQGHAPEPRCRVMKTSAVAELA